MPKQNNSWLLLLATAITGVTSLVAVWMTASAWPLLGLLVVPMNIVAHNYAWFVVNKPEVMIVQFEEEIIDDEELAER